MSEVLKGGLADGKTIEDIARKHSLFVGTIKLALEKGIKVEREHTNDIKAATEIAMDHLWEDPEYYEKLEKMEKGKCNDKKKEAKEQTMADASGSYEGQLSAPILKRDIYKLHNSKKINEVADSSISAGAMYDAPIGHKTKDPLTIDNPETSSENIIGNEKGDKNTIAVKKKNFPKFGGPESKFVAINSKCKKFPYCNQGDPKNSKLYEIKGMKEAVEEAAKKYGLTIVQVEEMIISEAYALPNSIDFKPATTWGKKGEGENFEYQLITVDRKTKEPIPLEFKTKDQVVFAKLKQMLMANGTDFNEEKHPITGSEQVIEPSKEESIYGDENDPDFDKDDDIFANMKK